MVDFAKSASRVERKIGIAFDDSFDDVVPIAVVHGR